MPEDRKVFRTKAFLVMKNGQEHVVFWSLDPSYGKPGVYVREHDLYKKGGMSTPITDDITERAGLDKIAALEKDAAAHHPLADESYKKSLWIGDRYRDAPPWTQHPDLAARRTEENLSALRAKKPPSLRPK